MDLTLKSAGRFLVVLLAVLALALTGLTATYTVLEAPAAHAARIEPDSGAFTGTAEVAKAFEYCRKAADGTVEWERKEGSPGLGLPDPAVKKNGWWGLSTSVTSLVKGIGELNACGYLTAMVNVDYVELGAACGASKGWNGIGTIEWADDPLPPKQPKKNGITQLADIGWKVSIGGVLIVTANMVDPNNKANKIGFLHATVLASGGEDCLEKGPGQPAKGNPKNGGEQGANEFDVVGTYEAVRHYGKASNPPKKRDLPEYEEKKEPHRKSDTP